MANFRDAAPPKRTALLFLVLLAFKPLPGLAGPTVQLGANLEKLTSLFRSDSAQKQPTGTQSILGLGFNPLATQLGNLPQLPSFGLQDLGKFTQDTIDSITKDVKGLVDPGPLSPEFAKLLDDASKPDPSSPETAEAVANLALLSAIFNLVSSILYTVSGALGTGAASLALIPASLATVTGPIGFALSAQSFASTLKADFRASDGAALKSWSDALTALGGRLTDVSNGKMADNVGGLRLQLAEAKGLLADAIGKYAGNVTKLG